MPRKVVRRRRMRGKGFGDFLASALGGVGTGVGGGVRNLVSSLFGGRKRRGRKVGGKRRGRKQRGGAEEKSLFSRLNQVAKDSKIISKALGEFGPGWAASGAEKLGYGRRRRKMRGGMMFTTLPAKYHIGAGHLNF